MINKLKSKKVKSKRTVIIEEYYNSICTNIQFLCSDKKVILFSSHTFGEGKTTVCFNIAKSFAKIGKKILVIELDIRKPAMYKKFGMTLNNIGITNYLEEQTSIDEVIYHCSLKGLDFIPRGKMVSNPLSALQSPKLKELVDEMRKRYDYILIDTPPVGIVADSSVISGISDGGILVVESNRTRTKYINYAIQNIEKSGCEFLGVILNKYKEKDELYGIYGSYGNY